MLCCCTESKRSNHWKPVIHLSSTSCMKISVHTSEKTEHFTVMKTNLLHKEIIASHETPQIGFSVWYFWNVTPCRQKINVTEEPVFLQLLSWMWRILLSQKCWYICTILQGTTTEENERRFSRKYAVWAKCRVIHSAHSHCALLGQVVPWQLYVPSVLTLTNSTFCSRSVFRAILKINKPNFPNVIYWLIFVSFVQSMLRYYRNSVYNFGTRQS